MITQQQGQVAARSDGSGFLHGRSDQTHRSGPDIQAVLANHQAVLGRGLRTCIVLADHAIAELGRPDHIGCRVGRVQRHACAVELDAVGVAQDVVRRLTEDDLRAGNGGAASAHHLIEDGAGGDVSELPIGANIQGDAVELYLPSRQAVVQHQTGCTDVVVLPAVVGKTLRIGRDDIDDRYAGLVAEISHAHWAISCNQLAGRGRVEGSQQDRRHGESESVSSEGLGRKSCLLHDDAPLWGL